MVRFGKWSAVMYAPFAVNGIKHEKPLLFYEVRYKYITLKTPEAL